ncbi:MAG: hypothetical protein AVDCRST_MAG34-2511, partial [uncultured Nocardioidaceae bacterium]
GGGQGSTHPSLVSSRDGAGVQRRPVVLAWSGTLALRHRPRRGVRRARGDVGVRQLRLGHDPGRRAHRRDRVDHLAVPPVGPLPRAGQGVGAEGRGARRGGHRDGTALGRPL